MKNISGIFVLVIAVAACDVSKYVTSDQARNSNTTTTTPVVENKVKEQPKPEASPARSNLPSVLKKMDGKYPAEAKLFDNEELKTRLKELLGKDYSAMRSHWNVETPNEIVNGIFKASACEAHNCGANNYYIFVDLDGDNINVIHVEDEKPTTYYEKGRIKLPAEFAGDIPTK